MKVTFVDDIDGADIDRPFAIYQYDEVLSQQKNYIDVKSIIRANGYSWLDDLQKSHVEVSSFFCRFTRWWWVTPMSRLDARPWGQECIIKPLFFAQAILFWVEHHNDDADDILLVGCPREVKYYLKQFGVEVKGNTGYDGDLIHFARLTVWVGLKLLKQILFYARNHVFRTAPLVESTALVFYELVQNDSLTDGHKFYYGTLFDGIEEGKLQYIVSTNNSCRVSELRRQKNSRAILLFDFIRLYDFVVGIFVNIAIIGISWVFLIRAPKCCIGGNVFSGFWPMYLFNELNRLPCFPNYLIYRSLKNLFQRGKYQKVIYPYEEKGAERAILFACREHNIATIGYTPHPQHRLTLALRDGYQPEGLRLRQYAVCGSRYVEYLRGWANKKDDVITIWGSGKEFVNVGTDRKNAVGFLRVLFLVSHPNELKVFGSWLRAEKSLREGFRYDLRLYKALKSKELISELNLLLKEFSCLRESCGSLVEDLSESDLAIFCATSAGIAAIKHGIPVVHVQLDDFFGMNPCFDSFEEIETCQSAKELVASLEETAKSGREGLSAMIERQKVFAETIFGPVWHEHITREFL